jgi:beta-lactam-binding protein with PASTA domain
MPTRIFAITAARETVILDNQGRAEVSFTASNTAPKSIAGQAKLVAIGSTKEAWLTLDGEPERKLAKGESHQFTVRIAVPPGTPTGKYAFRLNIISVENPDEDFTEGPSVSFEVRELAPAAPPPRKFPWWIVALAAVVIVGAGLITWLLIPPKVAEVPELIGRSAAEVGPLVQEAKLQLKIEAKSAGGKPGTIIDQNPKAGERVAPGTMITAFVEPEPNVVAVPDVIGVPVDKVAPILQGSKFQYQVNDQRVITGKVPIGAVANQSPAAGERVPPGTKVVLTVEAESVQVPDLTGTRVDYAFDQLRSLKLTPQYRDGDFAGKLAALLPVVWQQPGPGTRVAPGTTVVVNAVK